MASQDLGYAEPEIELYANELANRLMKVVRDYRYEAENKYAFNYCKGDGSYSNPNAEHQRKMAILMEAAATELVRLSNRVK